MNYKKKKLKQYQKKINKNLINKFCILNGTKHF